MREVIRVDQIGKEKVENGVEFTHLLDSYKGWADILPDFIDEYTNKIVYLGKCAADGDMFAIYYDDYIQIVKGHLNSGKY